MIRIYYFSLWLFISLPVLLPPAEVSAQSSNQKYIREEYSPLGSFSIEYKYDYVKENHQIWLKSYSDTLGRVLLYSFKRDAAAVVSPDENWIIINDFYGSDVSRLVLMRRVSGMTYTPVKDRDICREGWELFRKTTGRSKPFLSHQYAECLLWSGGSSYALLRFWGHGESDYNVDNWLCIYDVRNNRFLMDLSVINRNSTNN